MEESVTARAPGKILWIGGYSVLERPNISMVSAVDAYVYAKLKLSQDSRVTLNALPLNMVVNGGLSDTGSIKIEAPKELLLLKTAAEVALRYLSGSGVKVSGAAITTNNDKQFSYSITKGKIVKSGLGSSAALTVATIRSILKAYGVDEKKDDALHKLSQIAHSLATGKVGSGFDIAAAAHGSILYTRYSPEIVKGLPAAYTNEELVKLVKKNWDCKIEPFSLPNELKLSFSNFVGEAMITTKAVGSVSEFKAKQPEKYAELMKKINDENVLAIAVLKKIKNGDNTTLAEFKEAFDRGRLYTKELGVSSNVSIEPDDCTALIEESRKNGAFVAKLPGAGGKDAIAALSLSEEERGKLRNFWSSRKELSLLTLNAI